MPALYALAQHDALVEADGELLANERLFSSLGDLYVTTTKARARDAFDTVSERVFKHAGVRTHFGKFKTWSKKLAATRHLVWKRLGSATSQTLKTA